MDNVNLAELLEDHAWGEHKDFKISICPKCTGKLRAPYFGGVALTSTDTSRVQENIAPKTTKAKGKK